MLGSARAQALSYSAVKLSINQSINVNLYSASYKEWTEALNNMTIKYIIIIINI